MRILYGAVTMGDGHFSRANAIVPRLRGAGVEVDLVFSGDESWGLKAGAPHLQPYRAFAGLTYVRRHGKVDYRETIRGFKPRTLARDYASIRGPYDLVVTDFEPLTAWWGRRNGVPTVGIAHHYALWSRRAPRPLWPDPLAELIFRWYAPVDIPVGLHWRPTTPTTLPPIIRGEVAGAKPTDGGDVLVYLPSYTLATLDRVLGDAALARASRFVVYPKRGDYEARSPNVAMKPFSREGFARALLAVRAVITGGGFTLLSECLHLGKPVYSIPEARQYEQQVNGAALRKWRLGTVARKLDARALAAWLEGPPRAVRTPFPDVVSAFVNWIVEGRKEKPEEMAAALWTKM